MKPVQRTATPAQIAEDRPKLWPLGQEELGVLVWGGQGGLCEALLRMLLRCMPADGGGNVLKVWARSKAVLYGTCRFLFCRRRSGNRRVLGRS